MKQDTIDMPSTDALRISRIAMIAATYAAATIACLMFMGGLAWGPIQFRISEALTVLAVLVPEARIGLTIGCALANLANIVLGGTGILGMLDVVFGSLATFIGATISWKFRDNIKLALAGPVVANALIIPAFLPILLKGLGFYTIPFTSISLDNSYPAMYLFGLVATAIGETVVVYGLGMPLLRALSQVDLVHDGESH